MKPFTLTHQLLCITSINFQRRAVMGYVEFDFHVNRTDAKTIKINCKQSRIQKVSVNDVEATFQYNDPSLDLTQRDNKSRNLEFLSSCHLIAVESVDPECGYNGEIAIKVPSEVHKTLSTQNPVKVCLHFTLEDPQGGIHFVVPDAEGTLKERGAHLYTYGHENSSRLWFPCVDTYSEPCTWKLEFTVDESMIAVSCGDLVETLYTSDRKRKTFHYVMNIPTAAPNICLAVGPFEVIVDSHMHEVTNFCLPRLSPLLEHTTETLHEVFEYFEELLSFRFPYSCYKQVFVDEPYCDSLSYASLGLFSTNLLHSQIILDQTPKSRQLMVRVLTDQFFGCYMARESWNDFWVSAGISGYLYGLWLRSVFGNSAYRDWISKEMDRLCTYELDTGCVLLEYDTKDSSITRHFPHQSPHTIPTNHYEMIKTKSHLLMRQIEIRIGPQLLLQAFNKLLSLAQISASQKGYSPSWSSTLLSKASFLKSIYTVSGKDISNVIEQWVMQGVIVFNSSFVFNRKRNTVELEITQVTTSKASSKYVGPLTVRLQELDGTFNHTIQVEDNTVKHDIPCHSKSRRNKKKKIPLLNGEEADIDLNAMDPDSPVLWLRIDPDLNVLRRVNCEQPDYMWQYQAKYERDVVGQSEAIGVLKNFPSLATRTALSDIVENEKFYYIIRMEASDCLYKVANAMVDNWTGPPAMIDAFTRFYCCDTSPPIVRMNTFDNLQQYFLQKHIPVAMSYLRDHNNQCPKEVLHFLLDLVKFNDNSKNSYSDNYYRAALIKSLSNTVTEALSVSLSEQKILSENMSVDMQTIVDEVTRSLNLEKHLPSYRYTVTVSCLHAIRNMQYHGHLPQDSDLFKSYAGPGFFGDIRLAAISCLINGVKTNHLKEDYEWLFSLAQHDRVPHVKIGIMHELAENPPFLKEGKSPLNNSEVIEQLWNFINHETSHNCRLRCEAINLYHKMFGRGRPSCLPLPQYGVVVNLKEKKTQINPAAISHEEEMRYADRHYDRYSPEIGDHHHHHRKRHASSPDHLDDSKELKMKIKFGGNSGGGSGSHGNTIDTDDVMAAESLLFLSSHSEIPSRPSTPGGAGDHSSSMNWSPPPPRMSHHHHEVQEDFSRPFKPQPHEMFTPLGSSHHPTSSPHISKEKKKKKKHKKHKHKHHRQQDSDWSSPATPSSSVTSPFAPSPFSLD